MAQQKQAKGQKIGRHSRAPSNKTQVQRSARNKARNIKNNPESVKGENHVAGRPQFKPGQPTRLSRIPSLDQLRVARLAREEAHRDIASYADGWTQNVTFAEKVLKAVRPTVNLHDWKLAQAFQRKQAALKNKRV